MTSRQLRPAYALAVLLTALLVSPVAEAQKVLVNEFFRNGNLTTTDEWVEIVLTSR